AQSNRIANLSEENGVFTIVDETATPEGGFTVYYEKIASNLKYPKAASDAGIEGKVFVQFVVGEDGKLYHVTPIKYEDESLAKAAVEAILNSGDWTPAKHDGKIVKQKMVMPINFALPKENPNLPPPPDN
ncbi:MAG: energy transducer TonB, partial [Spongiibacter sp.]|nr:energy transducer TonB [Spongiibacter sp.]